MATRIKTIEYILQTDTATYASAATCTLAATTVYIPETTSRTFRSVHIEVPSRSATTTGTESNQTSRVIGVSIGGGAYTDLTRTRTWGSGTNHAAFRNYQDITSQFASEFGSGTSNTVAVRITSNGMSIANIGAKIVITYEYDDAATTCVKTVRIPMDSPTGLLTDVLTEIGTNQIPNLDSFLPESSKTYRQIGLEWRINDQGNAATDFNLEIQIDSASAETAAILEQSANSATYHTGYLDLTGDFTTNAAHQLKVRSTLTASIAFSCWLIVTYEYDESASSSIINPMLIALQGTSRITGNTASQSHRLYQDIWIEEPGTISLAQSGLFAALNHRATLTLNIQAGSQPLRAYTLTAGSIQQGPTPVMHRIDSGGAAGAAFTLARGRNRIYVDGYTSTADTTDLGSISFLLFLNYTSSKHSSGSALHNKSIAFCVEDSADTGQRQTWDVAMAMAPTIPESNYWLNTVSVEHSQQGSTSTATYMAQISFRVANGELADAGWASAMGSYQSIEGFGVFETYFQIPDGMFKQWPSDPRDGMDIETSRTIRALGLAQLATATSVMWIGYHSITYTISGTVSNSAGGTVNLAAFRNSDKALVGTTSRTGNGAYSITVYDDTDSYFVEAYEDNTHKGRTGLGTPS